MDAQNDLNMPQRTVENVNMPQTNMNISQVTVGSQTTVVALRGQVTQASELFNSSVLSHPWKRLPGATTDTIKRSLRNWRHYWPLALCLLLTLGIRLWLVGRTHGFIDGDEALVGIQAQHILRGELPAYYYGQPYMGSLEAYLIALIFAVVGSSTGAMRSEPLLLSLLLIWLTWRLAGALATEARLSQAARRWFVVSSTFFAAIPPLYDGVIEMRTWGGHIEIYILSLWLLLSALRLTQRWQAGASLRETAWRWAGIGLLVGLGMWVYPLIVIAVLTVLLWISGTVVKKFRVWKKSGEWMGFFAEKTHPLTRFLPNSSIAAIPAFLVGFAPALLWGGSHQWANVLYLFNPNNQDSQNALLHQLYPDRLALLRAKIALYGHCIAPRVIGGALPDVSISHALLQASVGITVIVVSLALVVLACVRSTPLLRQVRSLAGFPLIFAGCTACVFCASNISAAGLLFPCTRDEVGRYAAPLVLVLPFLFAAVATAIYLYANRYNRLNTQDSLEIASKDLDVVPADVEMAPKTRRARLFKGNRSRGENRDDGSGREIRHNQMPQAQFVNSMLIICMVVYLAAQAVTYISANPVYTFQSFACQIAPVDDGPIISYMQREHIRYAWGTVWIGNAIVFRTDGQIIVADPRIITVHADNRIPANTAAVLQADRPAVLAFALHSDAHPDLLEALSRQGVAYTVARFPSVSGLDVLVVQPNRTLSPSTANALGSWFYNC
jgi:hypothetical protein